MAKSETIHTAARLTLIILAIVALVQLWSWTSADAQTSFTPYQQAVLDDGASFYLTFDDANLIDVVGGIEATKELTGFFDADTPLAAGGSFGNGASPDAGGPGLTVPNTAASRAAIQLDVTTVELLFQAPTDTSELFLTGTPAGAGGLSALLYDQSRFMFASSFDGTSTSRAFYSGPALTPGDWYHLAVTHSPTTAGGLLSLYLNGQLVGTAATDGTLPYDPAAPFVLSAASGTDPGGTYAVSPIRIDELAVYPSALSAGEIEAHFDLIPTSEPTPYQQAVLADGPSFYVPFDSGSAVDIVGGLPIEVAPSASFDASTPLSGGLSLANEGDTGGPLASALSVPNSQLSRDAIYNENVTVEVLFKQVSGDVSYPVNIGGATLDNAPSPEGLDVVADDNFVRVAFVSGSAGDGSDEARVQSSPAEVDRWYHLAVVHEQVLIAGPGGDPIVDKGILSVYVDGALVGSADTDGTVAYDVSSQFVLEALAGFDTEFNGSNQPGNIDELAVYPTALTAEQIEAHVDLIDEIGPPPDPGTEWNTDLAPVDDFCGARTNAAGTALDPIGRCFTTAIDAAIFAQGDVASGEQDQIFEATYPEGVVILAAVDGCAGQWIDITGSWLDIAVATSIDDVRCDYVATTTGVAGDVVRPGSIELVAADVPAELDGLPTRLPLVSNLSPRIMAFDRTLRQGQFTGPQINQTFALEPRMATQHVNVNMSLGGDSAGLLQAVASDTAYGDEGRTLRGRREVEFSFPLYGTAETLNVTEDDGVEFDIVWVWENNDSDPRTMASNESFDLLVAPVLQPLRMASFGDSFAAGEGSTTAENHPCSRSPYAYSGRVVQLGLFDTGAFGTSGELNSLEMRNLVSDLNPTKLDRTGSGAEWYFAACTGAVSRNVWGESFAAPSVHDPQSNIAGEITPQPSHENVAPDGVTQLANYAQTGIATPNAVTVTMGGNDSGFADIITACFINRAATLGDLGADLVFPDLPPEDLNRECAAGFRQLSEKINPSNLDPVEFLNEIVGKRLSFTYDEIRDAVDPTPETIDVSDPVVTVFGYPQLINTGCPYGDFLGEDNILWLALAGQVLNSVIEERAEAAGFVFVEPIEFQGHAICDPDAYLNALSIDLSNSNTTELLRFLQAPGFENPVAGLEVDHTKSFHPNVSGWEAYRDGWERVNQSSGQRNAAGLRVPANATGAFSLASLQVDPGAQLDQLTSLTVAAGSVTFPAGEVVCGFQTFDGGDTIDVSISGAVEGPYALALGPATQAPIFELFDVGPEGDGSASMVLPNIGSEAVLAVVALDVSDYPIVASRSISVTNGGDLCGIDDEVQAQHDDMSVSIPVLANDLTDGSPLDPATVRVAIAPAHGTATIDNGSIVYTPDPWTRTVERFTYGACDGAQRCVEAEVVVDFTGGCTIIGGSAEVVGTDGDDVICGTMRQENIDAGAGDDIVYAGDGQDIVDMGSGGGSVFVEPYAFEVVATSQVTVTVPSGGTTTVSVVDDDHPRLTDDVTQIVDSVATVFPLENDTHGTEWDLSTFALTSLPANVVVDDVAIENGTIVVTFRPDVESGVQTAFYEICDVAGRCATGKISIQTDALPPSVSPVLEPDAVVLMVDESMIVDVLANDTDPDGDLDPSSLRVISASPGIDATTVFDGDAAELEVLADSTADPASEVVYEVCDLALNCAQATLSVTVLLVSDCTISGTDSDDVLTGTPGDDVICGFDGADTIDGGDGNDIIFGGKGADDLSGGDGDDLIRGNRGADLIRGNAGNDELRGGRGVDDVRGGNGNDELHGGRGQNTLTGGSGDDVLFGGSDADVLEGNGGNDVLHGRAGPDVLRGGGGADVLIGNRGADELFGQGGDDMLEGRRGADHLDGGNGIDVGDGGRGSDTCVDLETMSRC